MIHNPVVMGGGDSDFVWKEANLVQTFAPDPGTEINLNGQVSFSDKPQVVLMRQLSRDGTFYHLGALFDVSFNPEGYAGYFATNYGGFNIVDNDNFSWDGNTLNFIITTETNKPIYCAAVG